MSVTLIIIIITVAASLYAMSNTTFYYNWLMIPYKVLREKQYHRFLTSGFIHSGYAHLAFNMLSFYFFARIVEDQFGPLIFAAFYLLAIIFSDLPTFFKQRNNPSYHSLGASGGVAAVIFSSILFNPLGIIRIYFIPITGFVFGILYLIYSYFQSKNSTDNIGHEAHFYGAVFGVVFTIIWDYRIVPHFISELAGWRMF